MMSFSTITAIASITAVVIMAAALYFMSKPEAQPTTRIVKITNTSDLNTINAVVRTHFKFPPRKPQIVWQNPADGSSLSEKFILSNIPKAKRAAAFKSLQAEGIRRVKEVCRGFNAIDRRWSIGYCTYEDAPLPVVLKG